MRIAFLCIVYLSSFASQAIATPIEYAKENVIIAALHAAQARIRHAQASKIDKTTTQVALTEADIDAAKAAVRLAALSAIDTLPSIRREILDIHADSSEKIYAAAISLDVLNNSNLNVWKAVRAASSAMNTAIAAAIKESAQKNTSIIAIHKATQTAWDIAFAPASNPDINVREKIDAAIKTANESAQRESRQATSTRRAYTGTAIEKLIATRIAAQTVRDADGYLYPTIDKHRDADYRVRAQTIASAIEATAWNFTDPTVRHDILKASKAAAASLNANLAIENAIDIVHHNETAHAAVQAAIAHYQSMFDAVIRAHTNKKKAADYLLAAATAQQP